MSKHTPGPWTIEELVHTDTEMPYSYIEASQGWANSGMQNKRTVAVVGHWKDRPNPQADARLIAQSPNMLAELEKIRVIVAEEMYDSTDMMDALDKIDAIAKQAIAKATDE